MSDQLLLQMQGIKKSFVGVEVLHGVDLDLRAGEIHAIVGENGAGKSTLMKTLAGVHMPTEGKILINGEEQTFHHPAAAQAAGVGIVYQEFNLLPERNVAENIFIGREPRKGLIVDAKRMERETQALLDEVGEDSFGPRTPVRWLSVAQQQVVEIIKARSLNAKILVLDEPTAALAEGEVELLFKLVRRLQELGVGILYISHRLREVFALSQRITVIKDGGVVKTLNTAETNQRELVNAMVGRELDGYFPEKGLKEDLGDVRLAVKNLTTPLLKDVTFDVRAGEIVGLAGLQGSGRTEIARAIFGADPITSGTVEIDGKERRFKHPRQAIRAGIGFITEDRKAEGLALAQSIRDNMLLAVRTVIPARKRRSMDGLMGVKELARVTELKAQGPEQEVRFLSGGNQQKVVLSKWLETQPNVMIFDEPTRGIDVGAKAGIHDLIRKLAKDGKAVLMISSELPELIGMSDRILVMHEGKLAGELPAGASEPEIMEYATGSHEEVAA
ncbi:sugar ABC transporter ATP-binding protein [Solirubrobacter sp. CPCC 204708]|uniref:Sugar ABC transporter ATP-binding protein n=1 Tax=Solirubrobacter deserti TaxID=2282478 RepID=A0ABT4RJA8_9ACTN|nr:sugar ABC transporter ATP-binding protein [Solirubrobacter deserti]MBE2317679.1 sugar ABC transporter ATP-binding protein [Solirubrobacter deserti]MDA0138630.1 sugar ABC transporter ATP-binding protein [Solirubrobacter deserti]